MRTVFLSAILPVASCVLTGQNATFTSPQGGYVFNRYLHRTRPAVGIPRAAQVRGGIGDHLDCAWPGPGYHMAIAVRQGQTIWFRNPGSQPPTPETPAGILAAPTLVAWNSKGSFAALYSGSAHQFERISFNQGSVTIDMPIKVAPFGTEVTGIAVDKQGAIVLAAYPDSNPDYVHPASVQPPVEAAATTWLQGAQSAALGGSFSATVPLTLTGGSTEHRVHALQGVSVTATDDAGTSPAIMVELR